MGYIDKTTLTLDAILTNKGRDYLRKAVFGENKNGEHVITKFALSDDEVDYGLWDTTPSGSNFAKPLGQVIDNMPVIEPIVTDNEIMTYFLFKDGIEFTTEPEVADNNPPYSNFSMKVRPEKKEKKGKKGKKKGKGKGKGSKKDKDMFP